MSYCIEYSTECRKKYPIKQKRTIDKRVVLVIVCAALCAALANPGVRNSIKNHLLPGDPEVTEAAIVSMMERIGAGDGLYDAITVFCKEIIQGAAA